MQTVKHKELAKRLAINAINNYRLRFIHEEDLLNGEDRRKVLIEIDRIIDEIKEEKVSKLKLENGRNKRKTEDFQSTLDNLSRLDDCNEEFEL